MRESMVFVYAKDNLIKVFNYDTAYNAEKALLDDGWIYISTLDACAYIEYLHNHCRGISFCVQDEIDSLSKKKK